MAGETTNFEVRKVLVGGIRNDTPVTIADGEPGVFSVNSAGELLTSVGSGSTSSTTLAEVSDGTDGTYYYYVDMQGFRKLALQLILDGGSGTVTATVEGTVQDDGTVASSCTYVDVTSAAYGTDSYIDDEVLIDDTSFFSNFRYVRVKVVASTTGSNDADWTIYSRKVY